ncbi:hypothetical protein TVAG_139010 [Trichomonas vaginalis G3]|uniref:Uncharacterized protein n=1 Tax=Trichomonas vaginalis (strain ATCC PRA-98 / G3) TaxID=412133 RepID=A2E475_TRIV3|nr:hypothetical protein TVAGG3_0251850 [Trichomonas vaginalis G3]EAY12521.1 hypothetical protein TVAG_139010 [Trichomonas vaginalis G3]KAI5554058.1 hypothetical protein TVAGG3_0251850 [Trichomonas vaginalis G3]|eukprot:XP_001324744.1 hypothetical protein [Trichomonas vaginalis G3]
MDFPLESQHQLPASSVNSLLTSNENFRIRLHFEMGDDDVVVDGHNINFVPTIPEINMPIRLYQTDKIKYANTVTGYVLVTRFVFNISGQFFGVKSIRNIYPDDNGFSSSIVTVAIKRSEVDKNLEPILMNHIYKRHREQNKLIALSAGKQSASNDNIPIPFNEFFTDIRNSISNLEIMLREEHEIDPTISLASTELIGLKLDLERKAQEILRSLQERDNAEEEARLESRKIAEAASKIEQQLALPNKAEVAKDSKNDVAFAFSLIPLFVAFVGAIIKKKRK